MKIVLTALPGVIIIEPRVFTDDRGFFFESYHADRYRQADITVQFIQDNHSRSVRGTIRGLHYQLEHPQAKLLRVVYGTIFDVAVDIRRGSATFGRWVSVELSADNKRQIFIPAGFAHGFCVVSEVAEVEYKCSDFYAPEDQRGVMWNDPGLSIPWPVTSPVVSARDGTYLPLNSKRTDLPNLDETAP